MSFNYQEYLQSFKDNVPTETRTEEAACDHCGNYRMCEVTYRIYDDEEVCEKALCKYCADK